MFRRNDRRKDLRASRLAEQHALEIGRLKAQRMELEQTLRQVISASDDLLVDLRRAEDERAASSAAPGFAEAWFRSGPPITGSEDFFAVAQVDMRARSWLLASN